MWRPHAVLALLAVATGCGSVFVAPPPSPPSGAGGEGGATTAASSTSGASSAAGGASPGGTTVWSRRFGGDSDESLEGFAVSPAGNIALAGNYYHPVDFGGGPLPPTVNKYNYKNLFVVGLDSAGEHVFSHSLKGGEGWNGDAEPLRNVAFDPQGNIVVAGTHAGDVGFGCQTLDAAKGDMFLAKLDPKGACLWSERFPGKLEQRNIHVAVAPSGEIILGGIFFGAIDFGGDLLDATGMNNLAKGRMFLARFDGEGKHLWSTRFSKAAAKGVQIAVEEGGGFVVGGSFRGTIDFGGGPLTSEGNEDIYLARLDPAGDHVWSKRVGVSGGDHVVTGVAAGPGGSMIVSGACDGLTDLAAGLFKSPKLRVKFLARFDSEGKHAFSRVFPQPNSTAAATGVAARSTGEIAFAGDLTGSIGLGGTPLTAEGWGANGFVARYDALGHFVWDRRLTCDECPGAVPVTPAFDAAGNVFVAGAFRNTLDLGQTPLVSAGNVDIFVAKLLP